ncbi:hypothetical protein MMC15_003930 [Xylographa vitiligo]|nr:hypothetical protein [Xylographa vitiligo]
MYRTCMKICFSVLVIWISAAHSLAISPTTTTSPSLQPSVSIISIPPIYIPPITLTPVHITPVSIRPVSIPTITPVSPNLHLPTPTCVQTITPDANGYVPPGTCNALYKFYPSFATALIFSIFFGVVTLLHIGQAAGHKKPFCWVIIMGGLWETGSFITRTFSTRAQQETGLALTSELLVLLAPLWINAFDYMVLGRMMHFFLPAHSLLGIRASVLALCFVALDIVSFVIQLVGGAMGGTGAPPEQILKGVHIYMGGIGLQQFFIVVFLGLAVRFHVQMRGMEKRGELVGTGKGRWRWLLFTLYTSLALISLRIFFRLVEFSAGTGSSNPLPSHEIYFYAFDAMPMLLALITMNVVHPGRILVGPGSELPRMRWRRKRAVKGVEMREYDDEKEFRGDVVEGRRGAECDDEKEFWEDVAKGREVGRFDDEKEFREDVVEGRKGGAYDDEKEFLGGAV